MYVWASLSLWDRLGGCYTILQIRKHSVQFKWLTQGYMAVKWQSLCLSSQFLKLIQSPGSIFKIQLWPRTKVYSIKHFSFLVKQSNDFFFWQWKTAQYCMSKRNSEECPRNPLRDANLHNLPNKQISGFCTS